MAVRADVRHLVGHNEMVLGIDCSLHIVADDSGVLAARRHRAHTMSRLLRRAVTGQNGSGGMTTGNSKRAQKGSILLTGKMVIHR
jgi:hypothetical protein